MIECLFYLIDNSFVVFRNCVFRQVVGIPMGTNSGPQIANIYLHEYEYSYIQSLIAVNDQESLKKLENIFRYQDDLISFNDNGLLRTLLSVIYPPEMIIVQIYRRASVIIWICLSVFTEVNSQYLCMTSERIFPLM